MPLTPPDQKAVAPHLIPKFILLGEDDIDDEDLLKEIFSDIDNSIALQFINTGRKVLSVLEAMSSGQLPSLIVLDYNMPELNGAEILKILKDNPRYDHIPKVIWSTSGSDVYKKKCLELGAKEYVIKPSSINDLSAIARRLLALC
ncbi:response regulator [Terrimonas pollutisoli]|uniref:response regulator n=1 Tax=Terrimonas pollutisoli TaxID=3034147 RepID=UPI0023ED21F1|nr:response regulator [Terrimonas sp. H1YJ31]